MKQPKYAVTHPGKAHRDDFITSCLIFAEFPGTPIFRRNPTPEELADPRVIVFDIGGSYDPALNNYDHHQLENTEKREDLRCALSLWLEAHGDLASARTYWPWLIPSEVADCQGTKALAQMANSSWNDISLISINPTENFLLHEFGSREGIHTNSDDWLNQAMWAFGTHLINSISARQTAFEILNRIKLVYEIEGLLTLELPHKDFLPSLFPHIEAWIHASHPNTVIHIYPDDRVEEGICLLRRNDHPKVSFTQIEGEPEITFVPKSGHLAKIKPCPKHRVLELCRLSILP